MQMQPNAGTSYVSSYYSEYGLRVLGEKGSKRTDVCTHGLRVVGSTLVGLSIVLYCNMQRWDQGVKLPWSSLPSHGIIVVPFQQPICPLFNVGTTVEGIRGTPEHPKRRCYVEQIP